MLFLWWWQLRWSSLVLVQTHKRVCVCVWESIIVAYSTCIYAHTNRLSNTISCELPCLWRPRVLVMPTFIQESALFGLRVPVSYRSVSFRLSLVPSLSPSQLPDFVPLARSASVKLLAASEIHTNSIHFKCTCRQLPKKRGKSMCEGGVILYAGKESEMAMSEGNGDDCACTCGRCRCSTQRKTLVLYALAKKKRKQVESWKVISFYLNLLQIFLNYFN